MSVRYAVLRTVKQAMHTITLVTQHVTAVITQERQRTDSARPGQRMRQATGTYALYVRQLQLQNPTTMTMFVIRHVAYITTEEL